MSVPSGDVSPSTPKVSGTGDGGGVSKTAFWSAIITVLASTLILPGFKMYLDFKAQARADAAANKILAVQSASDEKVEKLRDGQIETHEVLQSAVSAQQDTHEKLTTIQATLSKPPMVGVASPNVSITVLPGPKEVSDDKPENKTGDE